jgi:predicted kinase
MSTKKPISANNVLDLKNRFLPSQGQRLNEMRTVYVLAGIPGAGKTTFVKKMIAEGNFPDTAYILDPDRLMEALPEYLNDRLKYGKEEAFKKWELPARELAYSFLVEAIRICADIIIDMGAARKEIYNILKKMKLENKYYIKMYWLETSLDVALKRIASRERFTPKEMVLKRMETLKELKESYLTLADEFFEISGDA